MYILLKALVFLAVYLIICDSGSHTAIAVVDSSRIGIKARNIYVIIF